MYFILYFIIYFFVRTVNPSLILCIITTTKIYGDYICNATYPLLLKKASEDADDATGVTDGTMHSEGCEGRRRLLKKLQHNFSVPRIE